MNLGNLADSAVRRLRLTREENPVLQKPPYIPFTPRNRATADPDWPWIKSFPNTLKPRGPGNREQFEDAAQSKQTVSPAQNVVVWVLIHGADLAEPG